jgi:hypothetical protein
MCIYLPQVLFIGTIPAFIPEKDWNKYDAKTIPEIDNIFANDLKWNWYDEYGINESASYL